MEEQARLTFLNIRSVCEAAGYSLDDVFQIRYTIRDRQDIRKVHAVIREFLPNCGFISSAYQGELLRPEMLIEVEANAYKAETPGELDAVGPGDGREPGPGAGLDQGPGPARLDRLGRRPAARCRAARRTCRRRPAGGTGSDRCRLHRQPARSHPATPSLDLLFNCAGLLGAREPPEGPRDTDGWAEIFHVNVTGTMRLTLACCRCSEKEGARS